MLAGRQAGRLRDAERQRKGSRQPEEASSVGAQAQEADEAPTKR